MAINHPIERVTELFGRLGDPEYKFELHNWPKLFADDFRMIANNSFVMQGSKNLKRHFDHIQQQMGKIKMTLHERLDCANTQVLRYCLATAAVQSEVMAIFRFNNGMLIEMNEVFHVDNPAKEPDMSR